MRRLWQYRRSVVMTWLISYMVVLFIPIVLSAAVYGQTEKTLEAQIRRGSDSLLDQMQGSVDNQVESMKRLVAQVYANVTVQNLFYSNKFSRGDYRYDLYEITQDLKDLRAAYTTFDDFYIYWTQGDSVVMPYVYKEADAALDDFYHEGNLSLAEWKQQVRSINQRGFLTSSRTSETGEKQTFLNFISSFPADTDNQSAGSVVVMINTERLLSVITGAREFSGGHVLLLNETGGVLMGSDVSGPEILSEFSRFNGDSGSLSGTYQGEPSQFYYSRSANSDLTYATVVPDRVVWKEAAYVRNLTYSSIAFSLFGGIVLTFIFLRRNYKPIGKLMRVLSRQADEGSKSQTNEFQFIERALSETMDEKDRIHLRMKQQNNQLRANFIARLCKGRIEQQIPHEDALTTFGISFPTDQFAVLLFYLEEYKPFLERMAELQISDPLKLMPFIVTNVTEEIIGQHHNGYMAEIDDMLACLIGLREEKDNADQLQQLAEETRQFIKTKFEIELSIAVSGIHTSVSGISEAYKEALDVMEYKLVMGNRETIDYESWQRGHEAQSKSGYYYPLQMEQQLINYVKVGDEDKARRLLEEIMNRNFRQDSLSVELARCLMFDLVGTFIKTMEDGRHSEETLQLNHPWAFDRLAGLKTVKDIHVQLESMLQDVCTYYAAKFETNKSRIRQEELEELTVSIKQFVLDHYDNVNLNISLIGETFSMKSTYLSKLFKDQSGESLSDYMSRVRIEHVKRLLREEKATLQEVAGRCGFNDMNTFMRTFKKMEGITPGQYKKLS